MGDDFKVKRSVKKIVENLIVDKLDHLSKQIHDKTKKFEDKDEWEDEEKTEKKCVKVERDECKMVPRKECVKIERDECKSVPSKECGKVERDDCKSVPRKECVKVDKEECKA